MTQKIKDGFFLGLGIMLASSVVNLVLGLAYMLLRGPSPLPLQ